jgi:hypothetical protein
MKEGMLAKGFWMSNICCWGKEEGQEKDGGLEDWKRNEIGFLTMEKGGGRIKTRRRIVSLTRSLPMT